MPGCQISTWFELQAGWIRAYVDVLCQQFVGDLVLVDHIVVERAASQDRACEEAKETVKKHTVSARFCRGHFGALLEIAEIALRVLAGRLTSLGKLPLASLSPWHRPTASGSIGIVSVLVVRCSAWMTRAQGGRRRGFERQRVLWQPCLRDVCRLRLHCSRRSGGKCLLCMPIDVWRLPEVTGAPVQLGTLGTPGGTQLRDWLTPTSGWSRALALPLSLNLAASKVCNSATPSSLVHS